MTETKLYLNSGETDKNLYLNCEGKAQADADNQKLHAFVHAALAGGGYALSRLYSTYKINKSTTYEFSAEYFRDGDFPNGNGQIYIFTRNDFEGIKKHKLEQRYTSVSGTTTRSTEIDLESGREYDIGFEIRTSGDATGVTFWSDFYNSKSLPPGWGPRHRVKLEELRVRY